jgi:hypothetical protein
MAIVYLKVVPNKEPNAVGYWIKAADIPKGPDPYDLVPLSDHHVVEARISPKFFHGEGAIDLEKQLARKPVHKFKPSWLEKKTGV